MFDKTDKGRLKDYISHSLIDSYRKLNSEEISSLESTLIVERIHVLEDVDKICKNRNRY